MMNSTSFLQALDTAAHQAAATEKSFRREAAERIKELERERSFAFRRLGLLQTMTDAVSRADSEEVAVAGCLAILRTKLGWSSESEAKEAVLTQFARVPKALFASLSPEPVAPRPDVIASMAAFETWYEETHPTPFWDLFDHPMPETPLVDF